MSKNVRRPLWLSAKSTDKAPTCRQVYWSHADDVCGQLSQEDNVDSPSPSRLSFSSVPTTLLNVCYDSHITCVQQLLSWMSPWSTLPSSTKAGLCHIASHSHLWNAKGGFFISTCGLSVLLKRLSVTWYPHTTRPAASARSDESYNYSSRALRPCGTLRPFHSLICNYRRPEDRWRVRAKNISLIYL